MLTADHETSSATPPPASTWTSVGPTREERVRLLAESYQIIADSNITRNAGEALEAILAAIVRMLKP